MANHVLHRGRELKCRCGGDAFESVYHHNPYGHDAGQRVHTCTACGTDWEGGYYDTMTPAKSVTSEVTAPEKT